MRRASLLVSSLALLAVPLSAQLFEGTIKMKVMMGENDKPVDATYMIKGKKISYTMQAFIMGSSTEVHAIVDNDAHKATVLVPMSPAISSMMPGMANAKGIMIVSTDVNNPAAPPPTPVPAWKDLGTSETIAGYKCEDFEMTAGKTVTRMCINSELGPFAMKSLGSAAGRRGGGNGVMGWVETIGAMGFPLKVWHPDGKVEQEVTSIVKGSVPADVFVIPDGYMDMSAMSGMFGRGRGQ